MLNVEVASGIGPRRRHTPAASLVQTRYLIVLHEGFGAVQYRIEIRAQARPARYSWSCTRAGCVVAMRMSDFTFPGAEAALRDAEGIVGRYPRSSQRFQKIGHPEPQFHRGGDLR